MAALILAVLSMLFILVGIVIYKNKIYKGALVFFYTEGIRKHIDIGDNKNKEQAAEIVGKFYIIAGCIFALGTIVAFISGLFNYVLAFVVLSVLLMFIMTYVRVNLTMTQN